MPKQPTVDRTVTLILLAALAAWAPAMMGRSQAAAAALDHDALTLQVVLDAAGISPGVIDGRMGPSTRAALALFQRAQGLDPSGAPDDATRTALALSGRSPTRQYLITQEDAAGPFAGPIPDDLMAQGRLAALGYESLLEGIAERFHTIPAVLQQLNPGARFEAGEAILVPDVAPMPLPAASTRRSSPGAHATRTGAIVVTKAWQQLIVQDRDGQLLFAAPVSTGSEHDPLPLGDWKVLDVYLLPVFHYNPEIFWDANPAHARTIIAPGPNNPVGTVWIDLDREHYGLHGTPEPHRVGRSTSHGCVRLTNWDALRVAEFAGPGTMVRFTSSAPRIPLVPAASM